jgi:ubiquinone/menaquinone biosynthesis C-methylase UbiE
MAPPLARKFSVEMIGNFDDEALHTFLDPADGGVDPVVLAMAMADASAGLTARVGVALPDAARESFQRALGQEHSASGVARAQRDVIDRLFWPLVYWNHPGDYEELVSGERIDSRVLDALELDGRAVCDIGAGAGRFTLLAAARAKSVVAVDAVPALLERLRRNADDAGLHNIEVRRGSFTALPLDDASVDIAVACSSFRSQAPHGGKRALAEAERVVRPGGEVAVVWPQERAWFRRHGFTYVAIHSDDLVRFRDVATAERLCAAYYSAAAAAWVRRHRSADVPYRVLGTSPPSSVCVKRVSESRRLS